MPYKSKFCFKEAAMLELYKIREKENRNQKLKVEILHDFEEF